MMHNLEKSPGMFSDRPGTTSKSLDLVISPTCLREKEREPFGGCVRFGGGSERDIQYKSSLADPTILSSRGLSAVLWRTVRIWIFYTATRLTLPLANSAQPLADHPRSIGCDTSGVSTFKYNQCTLVKVKGKFWEINSKRKGQIKDKSYKKN